MLGLIIAILVFNFIAFKTKKIFTANQIVHIWLFTIAFQSAFDFYLEFKYEGYWYFGKRVEWIDLLAHTVLIPPVNMMFLNWYPFKRSIVRQTVYMILWVVIILIYELITLLPRPFGYFNYGWWEWWHAAILDPFLLLILLFFYKWIRKLEKKIT